MDAVESDEIVGRQAAAIAPGPAHRNPRIIKVADVVVSDPVVGALANPYADCARMHSSAAANDVVVGQNFIRLLSRFIPQLRFADTDAAGTEIFQQTMLMVLKNILPEMIQFIQVIINLIIPLMVVLLIIILIT